MSGGAGEPPVDDHARAERRRERAASRPTKRSGVGSVWRALTPDQKLAAIAAIALLVSMLLPWYQETGNALVRNKLVHIGDSKNAFQVYSFVEAAIFVVSAGVLVLLYARGIRKAFHLPGGDGVVIMAAGLWVMFLIFYRQLDKPDGRQDGPISTSIGVEWGIFVAFLLGALLAYAGFRIRAHHTPEPVADDVPPPTAPTTAAPARSEPHDWLADDAPTVAQPRPPRRREGAPVDGELAVDDPAEYRPPPRRN
jgi:hypothetical protein